MLTRRVRIGWTRFMEWKYPIDGVVEKGSGPRAGSVKTFASL